MIKFMIAKVVDRVATLVAKKQSLTGCWTGCYRPEAPDELFK